jgi:hypothetical protein
VQTGNGGNGPLGNFHYRDEDPCPEVHDGKRNAELCGGFCGVYRILPNLFEETAGKWSVIKVKH